jgi:hypothetical protein
MFIIDMLTDSFNGTFLVRDETNSIYISILETVSVLYDYIVYFDLPIILVLFYFLSTVYNLIKNKINNYTNLDGSNPLVIGSVLLFTATLFLGTSTMNVVKIDTSTNPSTEVIVVKKIENIPKILTIPFTFANQYMLGVSYTLNEVAVGSKYGRFENGGELHLGQIFSSFNPGMDNFETNLKDYEPNVVSLEKRNNLRKYFETLKYVDPDLKPLDGQSSFLQKRIILGILTEVTYLKELSKRFLNNEKMEYYMKNHPLYTEVFNEVGMEKLLAEESYWHQDKFLNSEREAYGSIRLAGKASLLSKNELLKKGNVFAPNIKLPSLNSIKQIKDEDIKKTVCEDLFDEDSLKRNGIIIKSPIDVVAASNMLPHYKEACSFNEAQETAYKNKIDTAFSDKTELLKRLFSKLKLHVTANWPKKTAVDGNSTINSSLISSPNTNAKVWELNKSPPSYNLRAEAGEKVLRKSVFRLFQSAPLYEMINDLPEELGFWKSSINSAANFFALDNVYSTGTQQLSIASIREYQPTSQMFYLLSELGIRGLIPEVNWIPSQNQQSETAEFLGHDFTEWKLNNITADQLRTTSGTEKIDLYENAVLDVLIGGNRDRYDVYVDGNQPSLQEYLKNGLVYSIMSNALQQYLYEELKSTESTKFVLLAEKTGTGYKLRANLFVEEGVGEDINKNLSLKKVMQVLKGRTGYGTNEKQLAKAMVYLKGIIQNAERETLNETILLSLFTKYQELLNFKTGTDPDYMSAKLQMDNLLISIRGSLGLNRRGLDKESFESQINNHQFSTGTQQLSIASISEEQPTTPMDYLWYGDLSVNLMRVLPYLGISIQQEAELLDFLPIEEEKIQTFLGTDEAGVDEFSKTSMDASNDWLEMGKALIPNVDFEVSKVLPIFHNMIGSFQTVNDMKRSINDIEIGLINFMGSGSLDFTKLENITPSYQNLTSNSSDGITNPEIFSLMATIQNPWDQLVNQNDARQDYSQALTLKKTNLLGGYMPNFKIVDPTQTTTFGKMFEAIRWNAINSDILKASTKTIYEKYPCSSGQIIGYKGWITDLTYNDPCQPRINNNDEKEGDFSYIEIDKTTTDAALHYSNLVEIYHGFSGELIQDYLKDPTLYSTQLEEVTEKVDFVVDVAKEVAEGAALSAAAVVATGASVITAGAAAPVAAYIATKSAIRVKNIYKLASTVFNSRKKANRVAKFGKLKTKVKANKAQMAKKMTYAKNNPKMAKIKGYAKKVGSGSLRLAGKGFAALGLGLLSAVVKTTVFILLAIVLFLVFIELIIFIMAGIMTYRLLKMFLLEKILPLGYYIVTMTVNFYKIFASFILPSKSSNLVVKDIFKDVIENGLLTSMKQVAGLIFQIALVSLVFNTVFEALHQTLGSKMVISLYTNGYTNTYEGVIALFILVSVWVTAFVYKMLDTLSPKTETVSDLMNKAKNMELSK